MLGQSNFNGGRNTNRVWKHNNGDHHCRRLAHVRDQHHRAYSLPRKQWCQPMKRPSWLAFRVLCSVFRSRPQLRNQKESAERVFKDDHLQSSIGEKLQTFDDHFIPFIQVSGFLVEPPLPPSTFGIWVFCIRHGELRLGSNTQERWVRVLGFFATILLLVFWSMFTGTVTLWWSADNLNRLFDDLDSRIRDNLDVLEMEEKEKGGEAIWGFPMN
ncbi:hypothetical protein ACFX13_017996 [Malus domestica]